MSTQPPVLGAAYGITQFAGLADIQQMADPSRLGAVTSRLQALSYIGFGFPYLLSTVQSQLGWSPTAALSGVTALAVSATAWIAIVTRPTPA